MKTRINKDNEKLIFWLTLAALAILGFVKDFEGFMNHFNSTLYAFSYKYGFISRGFVGTVYQVLDKILPVNLMSYTSIYYFVLLMTIALYACFVGFFISCLNKSDLNQRHNIYMLILFLSVFTVGNFWESENFGRIDIYFLMLVFLSVYLWMNQKALWAIVPLMAVCMCIHQGFTFTNANLILAFLFLDAMKAEGGDFKKKFTLFIVVFAVISALFLYFELFSHMNGAAFANELIANSKLLSKSGNDYNTTIIDHEIFGEGVYELERGYHLLNYMETPVFLFFFWPYLVIAFVFAKNVIKRAAGKEKFGYFMIMIGAATLLPEAILKVDYGRYAYYTFFYYIMLTLCLISTGDKIVIDGFEETKQAVSKCIKWPKLLIFYPLAFMPFSDFIITDVTLYVMDCVKALVRMIG